ncbi:MAG: hypothetical protein EOM21_20855 [Gammaproteobacteria bacterium]|nr:hypothetical protein [Gammaproteobacteria bacterium]
MIAALCLYRGAASIGEAQALPQSDGALFFGSTAFSKHRDWLGAEAKVQVAIVDRLNGVIRAVGVLTKRR